MLEKISTVRRVQARVLVPVIVMVPREHSVIEDLAMLVTEGQELHCEKYLSGDE